MMKKIVTVALFFIMGGANYAKASAPAGVPLTPVEFAGTIFVTGHGRNFYIVLDPDGNIVMAEYDAKAKTYSLCKGLYEFDPRKQVVAADTQCPEKPYVFSMYLKGVAAEELEKGVNVKVKLSWVPFKVSFFADKLDESEIPPSLLKALNTKLAYATYLPFR